MTILTTTHSRRAMLSGIGTGAGLMALGGCASFGGFSAIDAIRRLMLLSSERAFATLARPGGWFDQQVVGLDLGNVLGSRGDILTSILTSNLVKDRLEREFAQAAVDGVERAAPLVYETVRTIGFANTLALIRGGPREATSYLRGEMGDRLVTAMFPAVGEALRISSDPALRQILSTTTGVDIGRIVGGFTDSVDNAIWSQMGNEEAAIRANPAATRDPAIIGIFGGLASL